MLLTPGLLTGTNGCINKAIHMLLMHEFSTLNTLILDHYIYDSWFVYRSYI